MTGEVNVFLSGRFIPGAKRMTHDPHPVMTRLDRVTGINTMLSAMERLAQAMTE